MGHPYLGNPLLMEETIGNRIKRLRNARNLSLQGLADRLIALGAPASLTKAAVAKWESGDTKNMQNATFVLLCEVLVTDARYLIWGDARAPKGAKKPPPSERSTGSP